jgi:hypothetical protein
MAYATGKGIERDGQASIPWFRKAADQDLAAAQFKFVVLSIAFSGLLGTGVRDGVGAAIEALPKSADQEFGPAQFALGLIYLQGSDKLLTNPHTNLVQDFVESYKWLTVCWKRTFGERQSSCERRRVDVERKMHRLPSGRVRIARSSGPRLSRGADSLQSIARPRHL